jgi:ligand-binding sensor protein
MEMFDLLPREAWAELERTIHERFGLNARVYDAKGFTFTGLTTWCNRLCPALKSVPAALSSICSVAHQALAAQAKAEARSVVDQCDIGLAKICVPVIVEGELVGVVGGCGLMLEDGEVETFLLGKAAGFDEEKAEDLAGDIAVITEAQVREMTEYLESRVQEIVERYLQAR